MTVLTLHPSLTSHRSDEDLVARLRDGDDDAFTSLVERYESLLLAYARNVLGGSHHDAEECVQDAFIRALGFLKTRRDREITLKPWLYTITRNACLDRLRKPNRSVNLESLQGVLRDNGADPHGRAVAREQLGVVVGGLKALPDRQRAAIVMHELEGRSHESLGAQLGVSVAASKALVCRARQGMSHLRDAA
jgi:RNA polymerase sigma-70 factor (ECF subfamily)